MVAAIGLNVVCDVEVEGVDLGAEEVPLEEVVRVEEVDLVEGEVVRMEGVDLVEEEVHL